MAKEYSNRQKVKIPINADVHQNVDEDAIAVASPYLMNGYVDEAGNTNKRPGLLEFCNLGTAAKVDGMYWFDKPQRLIAASDGKLFKLTSDGAKTDMTGSTGDLLVAGVRVNFTDDGTNLVAANGGRMVYTTISGTPAYMGDADAPTTVTHVGYLDKYILANEAGTGNFYWCDVGVTTSWDALSFTAAESLPDNIQALLVNWRELSLIGTKSVDCYYNDETSPFSRFEGAYSERGCIAPYSVVLANNTFYFLDYERKFARLENRLPKIVSFPFAKVFQSFTTAEDAIADVLEVGGRNFITLTFPSADRTFIYDYILEKWYEWSYWNQALNVHERWLGNCSCNVGLWGKCFVGSRKDGKIYQVDPSTYTDDGDIIKFERRTGWIDHGTLSDKKSHKVIIKVKRGFQIADSATPYLVMRWRDNGNKVWGTEVWIDLQKLGINEFIAKLTRMGIYASRQYELVHTEATPLIICDAEEEVEILR